jgi:hypothetical protein
MNVKYLRVPIKNTIVHWWFIPETGLLSPSKAQVVSPRLACWIGAYAASEPFPHSLARDAHRSSQRLQSIPNHQPVDPVTLRTSTLKLSALRE